MRKLFSLFFILFSLNFVQAQENLVRNPSFETAHVYWNWIDHPHFHYKMGKGTSHGPQIPNEGGRMLGFSPTGGLCYGFPNYMWTELKKPLEEGEIYKVSFWVSLAEVSQLSTDEIGVHFQTIEKLPTYSKDKRAYFEQLGLHVRSPKGRFLEDVENWMEVTGYYTASGGEKHMIIGSFKKEEDLSVQPTHHTYHTQREVVYYYLDNISVTKCEAYPVVDIGNDTLLCEGESLKLEVFYPDADYKWNTQSQEPTIEINRPGTYSVAVDYKGCVFTDYIFVDGLIPPDLGEDIVLCNEDELPLKLSLKEESNTSFMWNTGSEERQIEVNRLGIFKVTKTKGRCSASDTIKIDVFENYVQIFPNPSNGNLTVKNENSLREISVFNSTGQWVANVQPLNSNLDLSHLSSGLYYLRTIYGDDCQLLEQFIIQK